MLCSIGKKLALMELKYVIATLYRHYVFRLVPNFNYDVEITGTMHEMYGSCFCKPTN
jgi:hypothetical protein